MTTNSQYVPVADNPGLVRDVGSQAVLNTDADQLTAYKKRRDIAVSQQNVVQTVQTLQSDINNIKSELTEVKELLVAFLKRQVN